MQFESRSRLIPGLALWTILATAGPLAGALPAGFVEQQVASGWSDVCGLTFAADGRMYVWERSGRIWIVENGIKQSTPFLDISEEVGGWRDYGLLGVALHPNFYNNGFVYLLYVVDRHHLLYFGTPSYSPTTDEYFAATIGRITRYTARSSDGYRSVDPASRLVLVGETIDSGFPILHQSHGVGAILFGTDGTLLASCGDGASYSSTDTGSASETYYVDGLADGIIRPKENIGAYRSQLVDSLNGKIIRIDPFTGDGLSSNPFFDSGNPRSARSRVWCLGLRNPCRVTLRPGTGSHVAADGQPGSLYIGDVGLGTWEDLHVCTAGGQNFGWPAFEGMNTHSGYWNRNTPNYDAPNPLYGTGGCTQQYFYFRNLIVQDTLATPSFPNPCDSGQQIPASYDLFEHVRPELDWNHAAAGPARTKIYNGDNAAVINVGAAGSPVSGPQFGGNCSIGGVWYTGTDFPPQYQNTYFHADYGKQWIKNFVFDGSDAPVSVADFLSGRSVVAVATHPIDGELYYVNWSNQVWKISYTASGNQPPTAVASADVTYGPTPLTVQFTGSASSDPEDDVSALAFDWDFGDGSGHSSAMNPVHVFTATPGVPTRYDVTLTVTDSASASSIAQLVISVNNTPPVVTITSPLDGTLYPLDQGGIVYDLTADISDAEHGPAERVCEWQTFLEHNNHNHAEPPDPSCVTTATISPVGCNGEVYYYRIVCTVTDDAGLSTAATTNLYPACPNQPPIAYPDSATVAQGYSVDIDVLANDVDIDGALDPATVVVTGPPSSGTTSVNSTTGVITYIHDGSPATIDSFTYTVSDDDGAVSAQALVSIDAYNNPPAVTITSPPEGLLWNVGDFISMSAAGSDPEDGAGVAYHWEIQRLHNDTLQTEVFVWDGAAPPDYQIPAWGQPGDRISYLVIVTVTDVVGVTATDRVHLKPASPPAGNGPPVAFCTATPSQGTAPLGVVVDAAGTVDPEGDYMLFDWDFGDGAAATGGAAGHTYATPGAYTVVLTATDAAGASGTASVVVDVLSPGLEGVYYDDIDLTNPVLTRYDPVIDFDWGSGSPDPAIGANTFSVRWTGQVEALYDETYTFTALTDDGTRLWIDGVLVIDSWQDQAPTERSGTIALAAGQRYDLVLEYYENGGGAVIRLMWSSASQPKVVIPSTQLFPPSTPNLPPTVDAGPDQVADEGETVHFSGVVTDDGLPSPPGAVTVAWTAVSGPATPTWPLGDADQEHTHVEFPVAGAYVLRLTASDSAASSFDEVAVTVNTIDPCASDTTPPSITCPSPPPVLFVDDGCEALMPDLTGGAVVSDDCTPAAAIVVTQTPAPGTALGPGTHAVTLTATDAAANSAFCGLNCDVEDRAFVRGNLNTRAAHLLDIGDLIDLVSYLFGGYVLGFDCQGAVDVNDDGLQNIVDIVALAQGIFRPAAYTIPPPSSAPGVADVDGGTVPSALGCAEGEYCP